MGEQLEAGFAKLQGEDFEYYMQTYSIILGRNSKKTFVDVDLAGLGGGMNISRQHAKIFYDFERKAFVLEVIGKNGCYVEGVHMLPGDGPVKLSSQDLLQIGDKKFYFLLPTKKIPRAGPSGSGSASANTRKRPATSGRTSKSSLEDGAQPAKKRNQPKGEGGSARVRKEPLSVAQAGETNLTAASSSVQGPSSHSEQRGETRRRADSESEISVAVQAEDRDVLSAASTALAENTNPGEWMPLAKLYSELNEHYSHICPQATLQRLQPPPETGGNADSDVKIKPWAGLLALLRRYPLRFIINTKLKGRITAEYVSLVAEHP